MPPRLRTVLVVAALSAGCSLFKFNVSTPETRRQEAEAEARKAEEARKAAAAESEARAAEQAAAQKARDEAIVGELETLRGALTAGVTADKAIAFAAKVQSAEGTAPARDGRLDLPRLRGEAAGYLERAAVEGPSAEAFTTLASLPAAPDTDAAVLRACPRVRPAIAADALPDFIDVCLAAARGDGKQLKWPGAKADLAAHKKALEARAAAEAAAAEAAKQAGTHAVASVFAAGRCEFGNCVKDGWTVRTDAGEVRVRCNFGNCLKDGWTAQLPGGGQATTRCNFGDCMKDGWDTSFPDGTSARTRCNFGNCAKDGWETTLPDGGTARTRCNFGDCFKDGWETSLPDGGSVRCRCNFGKCLEDGTTCD
jgi:hypothetical protein